MILRYFKMYYFLMNRFIQNFLQATCVHFIHLVIRMIILEHDYKSLMISILDHIEGGKNREK